MDLHPASKEKRTERWNSPAEEARRERKTGNVPKVTEKGGWTAHWESARKKDGRTGHTGNSEAGGEKTKETRRREEFEGVGCRHRRGRRFLQHCRRRRRRRLLSPWQTGRLLLFFLLFPIIDKTETAQYRDTVPRRRVGISVLSLDYSSLIISTTTTVGAPLSLPINVTSTSSFFLHSPLLSTPLSSGLLAR